MTSTDFDLIVLGWGKAGKTVAMKMAASGKQVALVEASPEMYGGTCINIGCVPTKSLVVAAERFQAAHPDLAKVTYEEANLGFLTAQSQRNQLTAKMNSANYGMADSKGVHIFNGTAKLTGPHEVSVNTGAEPVTLRADNILINTGATPVVPCIAGDWQLNRGRVVDSTQVQQLPGLPRSLVIIGGGPIGLEFASIFSSFGTKVSVLDAADKPFSRFDEDVAAVATEVLKGKGISFINSAKVAAVNEDADQVKVSYDLPEKEGNVLVSDYVLMAVGRRPMTDGLGLAEVGVELTERGAVKVDEYLRTSVPGIYAAGDVNGGPQFTYISYDDHRIVLDQLLGEGKKSTRGRVVPATIFLDPPLATVGLSEQSAREHHRVKVVRKDIAQIAAMPRPKILGNPAGLMKFLIDEETDLILGATLYCIDAQELINTVALAIKHQITATQLADMIFTHPSSTEGFNEVLG
ncbi:dihydrolipoyl dehydrogenase family protein [Boudabousia marimammalium]|uniref:Pyridine nucleotide-disulfide oxidoreductase n=1 Tax=Boudabousia marimammalium TaxID=156892 RepID=A0A1Q5PSE8_9ACTO|nr:NAD(P)/FAD-dependent oxidoreductase [Boudabousia marimammalium]OKL50486.1 pyridine nucleotide-disulfide oxidoreductase [Boudabousia marimammalium]